ncbi:MAG: Endonuclease/exonuclease/phosphatase [Bacteroidetes bacterium]|jgi:endonuclease/exonuclease/phosphatase family metal-dependent hydrolase|nr:Endonuclease/exonuclease/phosphatase [Bacteroidota bacterium]
MKTRSLLLTVLLCFVSTFHVISQSRTMESENLRILSWNIYMLPYLSWFNGNGHRAKIIGEQLVHSDYQIIVFQEAFSVKCRRILKKILQEQYPYQYGPSNDSSWSLRSNSGLWVLSKLPLNQLKCIKFKESSGYDMIAQKGAALFEGEFNGKRFQLMATHLQSSHSQDIREKQYQEISALLEEFRSVDVPQILCGDFNTEMSNKPRYETMLKTLNAENGTLSGNIQSTYDEINNTLAKQKDGKEEVIDYILARNTSRIASIQRQVLEFYHSEANFESHLSDHYALEATVRFAPSTTLVAGK